mmetsp:Transcript_3466/g.5744  ORF Transcript_3466/g.5744 Transcript_3466/m.5744 type:complete len:302 (+) Transcript_3466:51-956(+)
MAWVTSSAKRRARLKRVAILRSQRDTESLTNFLRIAGFYCPTSKCDFNTTDAVDVDILLNLVSQPAKAAFEAEDVTSPDVNAICHSGHFASRVHLDDATCSLPCDDELFVAQVEPLAFCAVDPVSFEHDVSRVPLADDDPMHKASDIAVEQAGVDAYYDKLLAMLKLPTFVNDMSLVLTGAQAVAHPPAATCLQQSSHMGDVGHIVSMVPAPTGLSEAAWWSFCQSVRSGVPDTSDSAAELVIRAIRAFSKSVGEVPANSARRTALLQGSGKIMVDLILEQLREWQHAVGCEQSLPDCLRS